MPRAIYRTKPYLRSYRRPKPKYMFDWKKIDEYIESGSNGIEIAAILGCCHNTLYSRCLDEMGMSYCEYARLKRSKGDAEIRLAQYRKATGKSKEGDTQLLMHLGKHRLGQVDKMEIDNTFKFVDNDPTNRNNENNPDSVPIQMPSLPGCSLESNGDGIQESGSVLA